MTQLKLIMHSDNLGALHSLLHTIAHFKFSQHGTSRSPRTLIIAHAEGCENLTRRGIADKIRKGKHGSHEQKTTGSYAAAR